MHAHVQARQASGWPRVSTTGRASRCLVAAGISGERRRTKTHSWKQQQPPALSYSRAPRRPLRHESDIHTRVTLPAAGTGARSRATPSAVLHNEARR